MEKSPPRFKLGDKILRIKDGRIFIVTFLNLKATTPVFSASSADGEWSGWGGPIPYPDEYEVIADSQE